MTELSDLRDLHAGHPFFFSHGEYSDYSVDGFFLPLEDLPATRLLIIIQEVEKKWKEEDEKGETWVDDVRTMLIPELIRRGLLLELTTPEVHVHGYDELRVKWLEKEKIK